MDKRFTDIRPMTCKKPDEGSEPPLQYVLEHYYMSHGIVLSTARELTKEYVAQWTKQESYNVKSENDSKSAGTPSALNVGLENTMFKLPEDGQHVVIKTKEWGIRKARFNARDYGFWYTDCIHPMQNAFCSVNSVDTWSSNA